MKGETEDTRGAQKYRDTTPSIKHTTARRQDKHTHIKRLKKQKRRTTVKPATVLAVAEPCHAYHDDHTIPSHFIEYKTT